MGARIRVAVYGVAFYAFMVAICSPQGWRSKLPAIHRLRLAAVVAGILFVLYLIYTEVVRDGRICPYCTSVHVITFLLFSLIVFQGATPAHHSEATSLQQRRPSGTCYGHHDKNAGCPRRQVEFVEIG